MLHSCRVLHLSHVKYLYNYKWYFLKNSRYFRVYIGAGVAIVWSDVLINRAQVRRLCLGWMAQSVAHARARTSRSNAVGSIHAGNSPIQLKLFTRMRVSAVSITLFYRLEIWICELLAYVWSPVNSARFLALILSRLAHRCKCYLI